MATFLWKLLVIDVAGNCHTLRPLRVADADELLWHAFSQRDGLVYLETEDGRPVRRLGRGVYEVIGPPEIRLAAGEAGVP